MRELSWKTVDQVAIDMDFFILFNFKFDGFIVSYFMCRDDGKSLIIMV